MKKVRNFCFLAVFTMAVLMAGCQESEAKVDPVDSLQTTDMQQTTDTRQTADVSQTATAQQTADTRQTADTSRNAGSVEKPKPAVAVKGPKILVTKEFHDFGEVGPATYHTCDFTFKNSGTETLKIEKVQSTCGCSVPQLKKLEYAPGEEGTVEVRFHSPTHKGVTRKQLYIISNDPQTPRAQIELQANVTVKVEVSPEEVSLILNRPNAGLGPLTVKGSDGREFSITKFTSTNNSISCDFNPAKKGTEFVLHPVVDPNLLAKFPNGVIQIEVDHPQGGTLLVRYSTLPVYEVNRPRIILQNALPGEKEQKEVIIKSNYGESLKIANASSRLGYMKIANQEIEENALKLTIEISMPEKDSATRRYFSDDLKITFENEQSVDIRISGWFKN